MILIGNLISFIAACFMMSSCLSKDRTKVFHLQFIQCVLLSIASWFFSSYSGIVANVISGIRNLIVSKDKFTKKMVFIFLLLSVIFGTLFNNRGVIGCLPMIANIQFALCCYLFPTVLATKYSIWVNVLIWIVYSFYVSDYATAISDTIILFINTISIIKLHQEARAFVETM